MSSSSFEDLGFFLGGGICLFLFCCFVIIFFFFEAEVGFWVVVVLFCFPILHSSACFGPFE